MLSCDLHRLSVTNIYSFSVPGDIQVNYRVEVNAEDAAVIVLDEVVAVKITLTSPLLREACETIVKMEEGVTAGEDADEDFLPREPCLRVSIDYASPLTMKI